MSRMHYQRQPPLVSPILFGIEWFDWVDRQRLRSASWCGVARYDTRITHIFSKVTCRRCLAKMEVLRQQALWRYNITDWLAARGREGV